MLVKGKTTILEIPGEAGETMVLRPLSWREKTEAAEAARLETIARFRALGSEVFGTMREMYESRSKDELQEAIKDREPDYSMQKVLEAGIVSWSYPDPVTPDTIALLDEATAQWAVGEILNLSKPKTELDRKNA